MSDTDSPVERLLRELDGEELEPSSVEIDRAMATGRRRVLRRRLITAAGAGAAALAVVAAIGIPAAAVRRAPLAGARPTTGMSSPSRSATPSASPSATPPARPAAPPPATHCTGSRLKMPAGATGGVVTGGDPSGRYQVGYLFGHGLAYGTVLWNNGSPTPIDAPAEDESISVNSSGEAAGSGLDVQGNVTEQIAWTYRAGKVTKLGDATHSYRVYAINEHGDLLVQQTPRYTDGTIGPASNGYALEVLNHDGSVRQLTGPGSDSLVFSGDIDDDGTVVGGDKQSGVATVWQPDGTSEALNGGGTSTAADEIRNGFVLGGSGNTAPDGPGLFPVVRWDLRAPAVPDTTYPTMTLGATWGINRYGWIAGGTDKVALAAEGGTIITLPVPPGTTTGTGFNATTISDDGHVIGGQSNSLDDQVVPVRWLCH
jgi:hypothetical protein